MTNPLQTIPNLPVATGLSGTEELWVNQSGVDRRTTTGAIGALTPRGPIGPQGDPGGNVMAIGLFTAASALTIAVGTNLVQTSGYSTTGQGVAQYFYDASVDGTYVATHPLTSFLSANSRGFRLDASHGVMLEQASGAGDAIINTSYNLTNTPTDNAAALAAILALYTSGLFNSKAAPTIFLGDGIYYFAALLEFHEFVSIQGSATSVGDFGAPTGSSIAFPRSIGGPIFQGNTTTGRSGTGAPLGRSDGSQLAGVNLIGVGSGSDLTAHGLQLRAPIDARRIKIYNVSGNGVHIVAFTGGPTPVGNVNSFSLDAYVHDCGGTGLFIYGTDVNAAQEIKFSCHQAGQGGVVNASEFANRFNLGDIAGYGDTGVYYNGINYQLQGPFANGGSVTPGTDINTWWPLGVASGASANFPLWVTGTTYFNQLPIFDQGSNSVYIAPYVETGAVISTINPPSILLNGTAGNSSGPAMFLTPNDFDNRTYFSTGVGGASLNRQGQIGWPVTGNFAYSVVGSLDRFTVADYQVINHEYRNDRVGIFYERFNSLGDNILSIGGNAKAIRWHTGASAGIGALSIQGKFGRNSVAFDMAASPGIAIGGALGGETGFGTGGYSSPHRVVQFQTAIPTSGDFARGEKILNLAPSAGGISSWICTTTGVIGGGAWAASTRYVDSSNITNDGGKNYVAIAPPAWTQNTAYSTNAVIIGQESRRYLATTGGTSSTTGYGPVGTGVGITDGSVIWSSFVFPQPSSAASGGPTGTGSGILDGTVLWNYSVPYVFTPDYLYERASPTTGIGYVTGAGGAVTQTSSRATGVTLSKVTGAITLVSAAGSASIQSFVVTNTTVGANDNVVINQISGTDDYLVSARVANGGGAFKVFFQTTGGTTTEQPVIQFSVIKGAPA